MELEIHLSIIFMWLLILVISGVSQIREVGRRNNYKKILEIKVLRNVGISLLAKVK